MTTPPSKAVDYLVVGAGASGMSFVDSLLAHASTPVSVLLLDKREAPGGHWHDAYGWCRLHQPARNYGVESRKLEDETSHPELRADRAEIISYYQTVLDGWVAKGHDVRFVGGASFDFGAGAYKSDGSSTAVDAKTIVDARYTENDLPLFVPPRFEFDSAKIDLIPPNVLPSRDAATASQRKYVVLGAGKTGQDTMLYLKEVLNVPPTSIRWVMPTAPWITARDPPTPLKQITCMEYLSAALDAHAAAGASNDAVKTSEFLQRGFETLEAKGKIYRIDEDATPTKFMDATLSSSEIETLRGMARDGDCIVKGNGRVASIGDDGMLTFADGATMALPWADEDGGGVASTTYIHCTAGAFNFGSSATEPRLPVYANGAIRVQELFQFPGFCFNGCIIGYLEARKDLSLDQKNSLCELPPPPPSDAPPPPKLGATSGGLGPLTHGHPLMVSLRNLRRWYGVDGMGEWLHGLRLFSLTMNGYSEEEGRKLIESNYQELVKIGAMDEE